MKKFIVLFLLLPIIVFGQNNGDDVGVKFERDITVNNFKKILKKAKKENKYIFVDCFTTWCGPCKKMAKEVFPLKEMGDFFNANFINISLQMDETIDDDEYTTNSRIVAKTVYETYNIRAYPTFLIFDTAGILVHRYTGCSTPTYAISSAKDGLNAETQY